MRPAAPRPRLIHVEGRFGDLRSVVRQAGSSAIRFWALFGMWCLSLVAAVWLFPTEPLALGLSAFTTVGSLVAWLLPRHPVGWLLLGNGLLMLGGGVASRIAATIPKGPLRDVTAATFDLVGWVVALGLLTLIVLLFPNGRLPGRRWKLVLATLVVGGIATAAVGIFTPGPLPSFPEIDNPFALNGVEPAEFAGAIAQLVFFSGILAGLASVVFRYRASDGLERQQVRWLAWSVALVLAGFGLGAILKVTGMPGEPWSNSLPMLAIPVAIAISLFRYRLWDLDLVVARTAVYGMIALVIVAIYVVLVAGFGALVGRGNDAWLAILATAIVATLFQPVKEATTAMVRRALFPQSEPTSAPTIEIRTLGSFRVTRSGVPLTASDWNSRKARQLLKILVANRGRGVHREQAIDHLWPEEATSNLGNRLAVTLSTLRTVLDPGRIAGIEFIEGGESIRLLADNVWVDVEEFLRSGQAGLNGDLVALDRADELYRGEFLPEDIYEDWAQPIHDEAHFVYLAVLRAKAELARDQDSPAYLAAASRVLCVDPWDEQAHLGIIEILECDGHHGEARRARRRYEARMQEIGISPRPLPNTSKRT